jgi:hypothetical protein
VRALGRKHEVRAQALGLGIPLAPGEVIDVGPRASGGFAASRLRDAIRRRLGRSRRVIVRGSEASGGESTYLVDDEPTGLTQALERIATDPNRFFLVEPHVDVVCSPNVLMQVDRDGAVALVAATDQRLDAGFIYRGSASPSRARHLAAMIDAARALAERVGRAGYTGSLGFDFVESPEAGDAPAWFLAELNARTNGASYAVALARRLDAAQERRGAPRIRAFVSGSEPGPPCSVAELFRRCEHLFFDRYRGRGVIPYGPGYLAHGQIHAVVFAGSRDEAEALYEDFRAAARREA